MKDALGNELRPGDLVAVQLERPLIWGIVEEVREGGIVTGVNHKGEPQLRLGEIRVRSMHTMAVDPRMAVGACLALRQDNKPEVEAGEENASPDYHLKN